MNDDSGEGMRKLRDSTTFKFAAAILLLLLAFVLAGEFPVKDWADVAVYCLGIFAGKEGIRYGASAYEGRS